MLATLCLALGALAGMPAAAAAMAPAEDGSTIAASISTSHSHTCALLSDDTVACWGDDDQGQSTPPAGTFRQVSAGGRFHSCGILTDGKASCWGFDSDGQSSPPEGTFSQLDTGTSNGCGIRTDGSLVCWGKDDAGQSDPPDGTFTQVSAGDAHGCALRTDGSVACWGANGDGRATPPDGTFRQVSAGETASCGIRSDGSLACWGDSAKGQTTPPAGSFRQVSAGDGHACALAVDGSLACWGADDYKQASPPDGTFVAVSAGYLHSCALASDGSAVCWGFDSSATRVPPKLAFGRSTASAGGTFSCGVQAVGTAVCWGSDVAGEGTAPGGTFSAVSAGTDHGCGLASDGSAVCWGANDKGQATPPGGTFSQLSAGGSHSCAIAADGSLACWGANDQGQATPPAGTFSAVSAGDAHSCALAPDGSLACWGANDQGQATPAAGTYTAVSAGTGLTCALRTDGTLACWGANDKGQASPPAGTFIAVSAADGYACGLADSGRVSCWGADAGGALKPPGDAFLAISAGTGHVCGLRADGLMACWGDDRVGQSDPPVPGAPVVAMALPDQTASQGSDFTFSFPEGTFSDPNKLKLSYTATRADGTPLPGWLHLDGGSRTFRGKPGDPDVGSLSVSVTATNEKKLSISDTFDIVVANTNDPPSVAQHIPDQAAREDSPFGFVVPAGTFADIDLDSGDVLTLSASREDGTPLPAWLAFDPASGTLSGTPVTEDVGSLAIRVTATDSGGLTASDSFSLRVAHTNHAPTVVTPIGTQTATEKSAFNFAFPADTFADRDQGDSLKFDATLADGTPLPAWLRFDKGNRSFGGTPGNADVGSLSIAVIATDGAGLSVTDTFSLVVANVNDPPTLALPIPDQAATQGQPFGFAIPAGTFADPDTASGDTLSLEAKLGDGSALPAWLVFDPASGTLSGTPGDLDVGSLGVTVTATDSGALSVSDTFTISVANVNDPPVISDPVPDQLATENQAFSYSVAIDAFSDAPSDVAAGDTLSYAASRDDGTPLPAWLTFDALTRTFSGTPAKADVGSVGIMITATDKAGASGSDTFAISVIASHDDPTAPAVSLRRGKTASATGAIPVLVDWSAGLEAQGAARPLYHLQVRTAKGTTWGAWKDYATARGRTSVLKTLLPGHLQLRIQVAGAKPGPWVEAAPFLLSLVQDKDPAVSYSGDWSSVSDKNTSGGSIHRSGQPGASVSITTPDAETIALVMPTGPALGIAQVCIDPGTAGQNCRVLDLSLQATAARRLAMQFTGLAPGAHTLTLTVSRGVVAIDAFIVMGQPEPIVP